MLHSVGGLTSLVKRLTMVGISSNNMNTVDVLAIQQVSNTVIRLRSALQEAHDRIKDLDFLRPVSSTKLISGTVTQIILQLAAISPKLLQLLETLSRSGLPILSQGTSFFMLNVSALILTRVFNPHR